MNDCTFIGRLTKDPEMKAAQSGVEFCDFTVAVDRPFKNKDGQREADFIPCRVWKQSAAFVQKYFHKGDGIIVKGRLETGKYVDKDGNNRTRYEVSVSNVEFPPGKRDGTKTAEPGTGGQFEELAGSGELPF